MAFDLLAPAMTLDQLPVAQSATILDVQHPSPLAEQLARMGLVTGERIRLIRKLPWGGPLECEIIGYRLSLRRTEAALVRIAADAS